MYIVHVVKKLLLTHYLPVPMMWLLLTVVTETFIFFKFKTESLDYLP